MKYVKILIMRNNIRIKHNKILPYKISWYEIF
jgi:hypothetical protein